MDSFWRYARSPMSRVTSRLLITCGSLLLALLAAEVGARVVRGQADEELFDRDRFGADRPIPRGILSLGDLIRANDQPDLIYELRPDLRRVDYAGAAVTTNSDGLRREGDVGERTPKTYRILGLGDSVMFGQGVSDGREYLARLEKNLNEDDPSRAWQVLNAAVPGYNTAQELAYLKSRGLEFRPDLVVLGFVSNDVNLPSFLHRAFDPWSFNRSALLEWFQGEDETPGAMLAPAPTQAERIFRVESDPEKIPAEWRHLVGWTAVESALDELATLSEEHGFRVLFFSHRESEYSERALDAARSRGFATCNLAPRLENYMREHDIERYRGSELTVSDADPHPSPIHHRIASDGLQRALERLGIASPR